MKYVQVFDKEWCYFLKTEKVACCDCGLIHTYNYRSRKGFLQRQAVRETKATYARRKRLGIVVKRK